MPIRLRKAKLLAWRKQEIVILNCRGCV